MDTGEHGFIFGLNRFEIRFLTTKPQRLEGDARRLASRQAGDAVLLHCCYNQGGGRRRAAFSALPYPGLISFTPSAFAKASADKPGFSIDVPQGGTVYLPPFYRRYPCLPLPAFACRCKGVAGNNSLIRDSLPRLLLSKRYVKEPTFAKATVGRRTTANLRRGYTPGHFTRPDGKDIVRHYRNRMR